MNKQIKILCAVAALAVAGQVSAATAFTVGGVTPTLTGWVDGNDAGKLITQGLTPYGANYGLSNTTGDGGETSVPEHSIDNSNRHEMVSLDFGAGNLVNLSSVMFGWTGKSYYGSGTYAHSEYTVMAYVGTGTPIKSTDTWASLLGDGSAWKVIGNYADASSGATNSITSSWYSSYWLIGAYNPLASGTSALVGGGTGSDGRDYVKLTSVAGVVCTGGSGPECSPPGKVPEPGSLALFGLALLGILTFRKRQQA